MNKEYDLQYEMGKTWAVTTQSQLRSALVDHLRNYGPRAVFRVLELACTDLRKVRLERDDQASANYWKALSERIHKMEV